MERSPIIITGVSGWLGSRFLYALMNGLPEYQVPSELKHRKISVLTNMMNCRDLSNKNETNQNPVKCIYGDLENKESLLPLFENAQGGIVVHIAGVIHPKNVQEFYRVNVDGTRHMLELSKQHNIKRFVYISSNSACGTNKERDDLFTESSPYNPYLNYGKSKMLAEQMVLANAGDLEIVVLRPPWFYGPQQPARQSLFFTMIRTGRVPILGDGLNKRSMAYIDNICQALFLAMTLDQAKGQIYWIADNEPYTMLEVIRTIESLLEQDFKIHVAHKHIQMPDFIGNLAYCADQVIQNCGMYNQKIHVLSEFNKTIACDISKAKHELGYSPLISLEEGMRRSIQWLIDKQIKF
jgi:nucleoside-diphosphate-sugar epimerase